MFKKILLLLSFIAFLQFGYAQQCGTYHKEDIQLITKRLLANKARVAKYGYSKSRETIYVPVIFHLVGKNDGKGRAKFGSILGQMNRLNRDYKDQNIQFFMAGKGTLQFVNLINSSKLYSDPGSTGGFSAMSLKKKKNLVNVYVCNVADTNSKIGITLGYYSPSNDWIVMRKDRTNSSSSTLSHEMGHFFSLLHPFSGWDAEIYDKGVHGNPVQEFSPSGNLNENQNRTGECKNCDKAGDYLCDTPPDYNFGLSWNGCSTYTAGTMDPCGVVVHPMENNYMAYFSGCAQYEFTPDQKAMIATDYADRAAHKKINTTVKPITHEEINEDVATKILTPEPNQKLNRYGNIDLTWEPVSGAIRYMVEIATRSDFSKDYELFYVENDNFKHFDELKPNKSYYWRVAAYNQMYSNIGTNKKYKFTTGAELVATNDIASVNFFKVAPNPSPTGTSLNLSLNTTQSFESNIQVFDIAGKLIMNTPFKFNVGYNNAVLPTQALNSGLYFIQIQTKDGTINEKIVIQ